MHILSQYPPDPTSWAGTPVPNTLLGLESNHPRQNKWAWNTFYYFQSHCLIYFRLYPPFHFTQCPFPFLFNFVCSLFPWKMEVWEAFKNYSMTLWHLFFEHCVFEVDLSTSWLPSRYFGKLALMSHSCSKMMGLTVFIPTSIPKNWELVRPNPISIPKCTKVIPAHA